MPDDRDVVGFLRLHLGRRVLIQRTQGALDFRRSNHGEIDAHVEHVADGLYGLVDKGIGGGDQQAPAVERDRQDPIGLEERELQAVRQDGTGREIHRFDQRQTAIGSVGQTEVGLGNQTEFDQHEIETLGSRFGGPPGPADGGGIDQVLADQKVGKRLREAGVPWPRQFRSPAWRRGRAQQLLDIE